MSTGENGGGSGLTSRIGAITAIVGALTALVIALGVFFTEVENFACAHAPGLAESFGSCEGEDDPGECSMDLPLEEYLKCSSEPGVQ